MLSFGRLTDLIQNVKALHIGSALRFTISQNEMKQFIIELNTQEQLFKEGVDSRGVLLDSIGGGYAFVTERDKIKRGLPFAWVTLFDSGVFYESFDIVNVTNTSFTIEADTIKEGQDLQDRWGKDILGLTDESIELLIRGLIPEIRQYIINELLR